VRTAVDLASWLRLDGSGSGDQVMRNLGIVDFAAALGGCAFQRAEIAQDARTQMVGFSKEADLSLPGRAGEQTRRRRHRGLGVRVWQWHDRRGRQMIDMVGPPFAPADSAASTSCLPAAKSPRSTARGRRAAFDGRRAVRLCRRCLREAAVALGHEASNTSWRHRPLRGALSATVDDIRLKLVIAT
jgi:ribosomal protein S14